MNTDELERIKAVLKSDYGITRQELMEQMLKDTFKYSAEIIRVLSEISDGTIKPTSPSEVLKSIACDIQSDEDFKKLMHSLIAFIVFNIENQEDRNFMLDAIHWLAVMHLLVSTESCPASYYILIDKSTIADTDYVASAISMWPGAISFIDEPLRSSTELGCKIVDKTSNPLLPIILPLFASDRDVMTRAIAKEESLIIYASDELKNDLNFQKTACQLNVRALGKVSEQLRDDLSFVISLVEIDEAALLYASPRIRSFYQKYLATNNVFEALQAALDLQNMGIPLPTDETNAIKLRDSIIWSEELQSELPSSSPPAKRSKL